MLPDTTIVHDCDVKIKKQKFGSGYDVHAINGFWPRGGIVVTQDETIYYDGTDAKGNSFTFVFSGIVHFLRFLLNHKDGDYTNPQ